MFRGFSKVFSFTFAQHVKSKGYKTLTIVLGVLCLALPILIMGLVAYFDKIEKAEELEYSPNLVKEVFVVDLTEGNPADFSILNTMGQEGFTDIVYETCVDVANAVEKAESKQYALVAVVEMKQEKYDVKILLPENTKLTLDDAYNYNSFVYSYFQVVLVGKSGLDYTQILELMKPMQMEVEIGTEDVEGEVGTELEDDVYAEMREIFGMILPYMVIMVLYFMILFYGQGVANSVIMEKTSKLMDQFLVAVKPEAMIMGKVLAIALAGVLQLLIWIVGIVVGFASGTVVAKAIDPDTQMAIIQLFESFGDLSGMFSISSIVLCILVILAGFLMYCALAAVGGAMAGKPEDLSNTNMLFTMALVISFLLTLYSGVMSPVTEGSNSFAWQYYIPFTAIFLTPSHTLLGIMTPLQTVLSLGCIVIGTVAIIVLAGKIYSMLVLYKGNPPNLKKVIAMLQKKA